MYFFAKKKEVLDSRMTSWKLKVATELAGKEYKWENGAREWEIERTKT
jgi:hypothetical protein